MPPTIVIDFSPLDTPTRRRGIGRYLQTLALGLSRLDPRTTTDLRLLGLITLGLQGQVAITDDFDEVTRHTWNRDATQLDRYRWAYGRRLGLWAAMRKVDARVVHLGDPNATPLAMSLARCKRVVTCHDLIPLQFPAKYLGVRDGFGVVGKRLIRRRYRSADHVVVISDATRGELVKLLGVPHSRISRVYNGVDMSSWTSQDPGDDWQRIERYALPPRKFLLYVGDVDWRKNPEGMIRGLANAVDAGQDVLLAFAGDLEAHKITTLHQLADRSGVRDRLRILGYVPDADLRALYRNALAHLFVSRFEGFGYTVVEAMASGCPVITTNAGSLAEVAADAALRVAPDDVEGIGRAIRDLSSDRALRDTVVSRGLAWAPRFSCERQAQAMLDVFRRMVS
jgi:glycosyltransferase involved in cell wall biosynthesis